MEPQTQRTARSSLASTMLERGLKPRTLLYACIIFDILVLVADCLTPAEYGLAPLYLGPVLLAFWLPWRSATVMLALAGTVGAIIGYFVSPESVAYGATGTLLSRGLSIAILWWAAALALAHQASRAALAENERATQQQAARLGAIMDTAPDALIIIDQRGAIQSFSRSAEILFGYAAEEVLGRNVSMLMPNPDRDRHDRYLSHYLETGEKRIIGLGRVVEAQQKDGRTMPVELSVGEANVDSHRVFIGFLRDLTARQRIEQELRQAQKMEAVGQLTGGIAHDFNNLLTVIIGNLEMIGSSPDRLDEVALAEAQEAASLGAQLTERLLAFGRRQPLDPKEIDVVELCQNFGELLRRTLGEAIEFSVRVRGRPGKALADPSQLQNAILNLCINARDAMPQGGKLLIEVSDAILDADYAQLYPEVRLGRYISVSVSDTGKGMTREVREKAFEPFFTTKPQGAGTGLGLSMVYGFAKQSNGHVQLYSEPGRGTTVRIYLPHVKNGSDVREDNTAATVPEARGETILVVEDDARVRRIALARLARLGYRVLEAESGPAALEVLDANADIDLVFTDIVMAGGMTGFDLANRVRSDWPGVKILFTSGYADPEMVAREQTVEAEWLRKPYTQAELATKVRAILD